jgi:hypothetical protein
MLFVDNTSVWATKFDDIPLDDQFAFTASERAKITAAGWRLIDGHWHDPQGRAPWERNRRSS